MDDLIVVDDEPILPPAPIASSSSVPRLRSASRVPTLPAPSNEPPDRTTRSSTARSKPQPKLKLKLGDKAAAMAPGMSFLGPDCDKLRKMVSTREVPNDVWFKFKDSRRAVFHIGNNTYSAKLVDLPCIVESQKTLDNKQMFKVADICQMLVVQNRMDQDEQAAPQKNFNIEEFIWPHGLTPPLHHVRKRRFRKRVNKRTIESVEQAVERLLDEDSLATQVKYDVLENVNPDLSDSDLSTRPTPAISDSGGMGEAADDDDSSASDGKEATQDDDEDDDDEAVQSIRLLNEEIRDLEAAIAKKGHEIASSANPLIKKRFEDALKKLNADLEMKQAQREEIRERQRMEQEGVTENDMDNNADDDEAHQGEDAEQGEADGDLFGSDTEMQ
ncbi:TAFII55 protein conserved region-domain-containing protein [Mycena amicta]|nr:TAFII55 protein conserved region-domain-containing protein [Mycena amicta]